jgi:hypothetical protein
MSFDIVEHVALTGDKIIRRNDRSRMMLGFATEDGCREWLFRLLDVRTRKIKSSEELFWVLILNNSGRDLMAQAFCHSDDYNVIRHIKGCRKCCEYFVILEIMDA